VIAVGQVEVSMSCNLAETLHVSHLRMHPRWPHKVAKNLWRAIRRAKMSTSRLDRRAPGRRSSSRKFFVPSPKMTLGRATMLHSEFSITPIWRANCQGVRPAQIRKGLPKRL
jgi:hypothetical protein